MPRNGSGVYSLPAGYLAIDGQTIQPAQHNTPLQDIAADLNGITSGSVSMNGAGVTPTGGSVVRTLAAKAGEFLSVKDFGAVGDGVTDDRAAIQAAIDYLTPNDASGVVSRATAMRGGGVVYFPPGIYRTTGTLYSGSYVTLQGAGAAMFPQQALTAVGQSAKPNGSIIFADFSTAFAPILHVSPFVLATSGGSPALTSGQTIGTRFKSLSENPISGEDVDNARINYCEGANIRDLTLVYAGTRGFAGIRWTAASNSIIDNVAIRNVQHGVFAESNWESSLHRLQVFDFSKTGYRGAGNQHSVLLEGSWIHAGGRVLAGDKPLGVYGEFINGMTIDAVAIDECWDAIVLQTGAGASINGVHSERVKNVWLTVNGVHGVRGHGNHIIQNVIDARTYETSLIFDGNDCEVEINVVASDTSNAGTFPGKTYAIGTNPNTGERTNLDYAGANRTSLTFVGMGKLAGDANYVPRQSGNIRFLDDRGEWLIAGISESNSYNDDYRLHGNTGATRARSFYFNGTRVSYDLWNSSGCVAYRNSDNAPMLGYDTARNCTIMAGGVELHPVFGTPEGFVTAPRGSLACDTSTGKLYAKTTTSGNTGWQLVGAQS